MAWKRQLPEGPRDTQQKFPGRGLILGMVKSDPVKPNKVANIGELSKKESTENEKTTKVEPDGECTEEFKRKSRDATKEKPVDPNKTGNKGEQSQKEYIENEEQELNIESIEEPNRESTEKLKRELIEEENEQPIEEEEPRRKPTMDKLTRGPTKEGKEEPNKNSELKREPTKEQEPKREPTEEEIRREKQRAAAESRRNKKDEATKRKALKKDTREALSWQAPAAVPLKERICTSSDIPVAVAN